MSRALFLRRKVPAKLYRDWKALFVAEQPLYDEVEEVTEEQEKIDVIVDEKQKILDETDLMEYQVSATRIDVSRKNPKKNLFIRRVSPASGLPRKPPKSKNRLHRTQSSAGSSTDSTISFIRLR